VIAPLFAAADAGKVELVASALTLLEVLVVPYRADNIELAERYEAVLTRSRGIRMVDLGRDHLRLAAQVRARTGAAIPDALQLAVSLGTRCSAFVTNDRGLPAVPGLRIIQLGAYVV
jgi:predicted nucleic acid-binding protein